jgi:hypothetical protein
MADVTKDTAEALSRREALAYAATFGYAGPDAGSEGVR